MQPSIPVFHAVRLGLVGFTGLMFAASVGLAFAEEDPGTAGLIRICYNGRDAMVSANVLGDYTSDGAYIGSCMAPPQATVAAESQEQEQPAVFSVFGEVDQAEPTYLMDETVQVQQEEQPLLETQAALPVTIELSPDSGSSHMSISVSNSYNGQSSGYQQVWENGRLVHSASFGW